MTRHFWNIYTHKKSTEALYEIEVLTRNFGYIVDYKKFAEDYHILQIDIEKDKVDNFFEKISLSFNIKKYSEISLNRVGEDEVFLNVKLFE
ncbi:MAG: hypothetical protein K5685_01140 [Bacteroidales bacterium]|nr:hypothetical protein [Bacteroidales bacterium]